MQKTVACLINTEALDFLLPPLGCLVLDCPNKVSLLSISSGCKPLRLACNTQDGCIKFEGWTLAWYTHIEESMSQFFFFLQGQHLRKSIFHCMLKQCCFSLNMFSLHKAMNWTPARKGSESNQGISDANQGISSPVFTMKTPMSRYFISNAWLWMHSAYKYKHPYLPSSIQTENIGISVSKNLSRSGGTENICSSNVLYADWFLHWV